MNIAFSFCPCVFTCIGFVFVSVLFVSAARFGKQSANCVFFFLFNTNGCVCVLYCNFKDSRQTPKGAFHQRSKQNIDPARNEMEGEEEKKRKRGI